MENEWAFWQSALIFLWNLLIFCGVFADMAV